MAPPRETPEHCVLESVPESLYTSESPGELFKHGDFQALSLHFNFAF